ncbi:hypothetical protein SAMN05892883_4081 [Jatrophihabitans sp. GAS493]|uniref:DUF1453 domain-containing protein n=1 Tax=Jatrophihabitans sp. GAS493 TaxID=1907575 RepID=UPI000BB7DE72|nr:DUF1453 domain-containing protein [Jatrophihabitans sp. GAS493]SOD74887.1 hypothetical protein SAMN05892883_4081 [Jatrophihabitans sp. GAS493]
MTPTDLLVVAALVGYAIYRQTRINEITGHSRFKLAIIYSVIGICLGVHVAHTPAAVGLLLVGLAASLGIGYLRGRKTRMWSIGAKTYSQGTTLTVGLFLGLVAFKFLLGTVAYLTHTPYESGIGSILLMIGLMLAVQAELIWRRAQAIQTEPALVFAAAH